MSCRDRLSAFIKTATATGSPAAVAFGGAEEARAVLEQVFEAARGFPPDAPAEQLVIRAHTQALFKRFQEQGIPLPSHSKSGMPKPTALMGYSLIYQTLEALEKRRELPALAVSTLNAVKERRYIRSVARDKQGRYRCSNCGQFARPNDHLCKMTATSEALRAKLRRTFKVPESAYPPQALDALIEAARQKDGLSVRHAATGEQAVVSLDGLALALGNGFVPDHWQVSLAQIGERVVPVLNAEGLTVVRPEDPIEQAAALSGAALTDETPLNAASEELNNIEPDYELLSLLFTDELDSDGNPRVRRDVTPAPEPAPEPTPEPTPEPVPVERTPEEALYSALLFLAGVDDGAIRRDGQGFNGADTQYGQWLASLLARGEKLSPRHAFAAHRMLQKYARQLEAADIVVPSWDAFEQAFPRADDFEWPQLEGSIAQVEWATKIREARGQAFQELVQKLRTLASSKELGLTSQASPYWGDAPDEVRVAIAEAFAAKASSAKFWIDHRDQPLVEPLSKQIMQTVRERLRCPECGQYAKPNMHICPQRTTVDELRQMIPSLSEEEAAQIIVTARRGPIQLNPVDGEPSACTLTFLDQQLKKGRTPSNLVPADEALKIINASPEELEAERRRLAEQQEEAAFRTSNKRAELHGNKLLVYTPYDPSLVDKLRSVRPRGSWSSFRRAWEFPVEAAAYLKANLPEIKLDPKLRDVLEEPQKKATLSQQDIDETIALAKLDQPLPNGRTLFSHQQEAVKMLLSRRKGGEFAGAILADDMGLGKTTSALVAAKALKAKTNCRVIVVCPAGLRQNWANEADGVGVEIEVYSWAKLPKVEEGEKYILIADEAHYAQDMKSQRTQAFLGLSKQSGCEAVWALTGTPIKNGRPANLYPLLVAIDHPIAQDRRAYEVRYCDARLREMGGRRFWDTSGASNLDELYAKTRNVMLRRKKADCLDLPPKVRQKRTVELSKEAQAKLNAEVQRRAAEYRERKAKGEVGSGADAIVHLNHIRQANSLAKVPAAVELAQEALEQDQPIILFTEFVESAKELNRQLGGELLTGSTSTEERQAMVDRFQAGESKVFVSTVRAGGVGITLTAASQVVMVDRPWTPGDAEQAEDRAYRIGQKNMVNVHWLQQGEVDEAIDALLEKKQKAIDIVLRGKRKTMRGIASPEELAKQLLETL